MLAGYVFGIGHALGLLTVFGPIIAAAIWAGWVLIAKRIIG